MRITRYKNTNSKQAGAVLTETALLTGLIAVVCIVALSGLAMGMKKSFCKSLDWDQAPVNGSEDGYRWLNQQNHCISKKTGEVAW